jgi:hypothetical protein
VQVYGGIIPDELNELNYNSFVTLSGTGHTLLPAHKRGTYTLISEKFHQGEIFKVSLSFKALEQRPAPRPWNVSYDPIEAAIIADYGAQSIKDRIFCALGLVAKFLNSRIGSRQCLSKNDHLGILGLQAVASGGHSFDCPGGSLLPLLGALQVVALEERLSAIDPTALAYSITMSVETYGHKTRKVVFLKDLLGSTPEERAREIVNGLHLSQNCVVNIIQRFSVFCAQELHVTDPNHNNLYVGVGATCEGELQNGGKPLWSSLPLSRLRQFFSNKLSKSQGNYRVNGCPRTEDDIQEFAEHQEATKLQFNFRSIGEGYRIPEKGRTEMALVDRFGNVLKVEPYPFFGGIPPSGGQPFTAIMYSIGVRNMSISQNGSSFLVKYQIYSPDARDAFGETGKIKITEVAAACMKSLSLSTVYNDADGSVIHAYRNDHHTEHLNNAFKNVKLNCEHTRRRGNAARMEITCKSTRFDDHSYSVEHAFIELLDVVDNVVEYYDIADAVATCTEFFALGLRTRSDFAVSQLRESNTPSKVIEEMLSYLVEESGHWQSFYSGRNIFSAKARICKRFAMATSRPILSALDTKLVSALSGMNIQPWLKWFLDETGVAYAPSVDIMLAPTSQFQHLFVVDGHACKHCGSIIYDKRCLEHPCTEPIITENDLIEVSSPEFGTMIAKWYSELSGHQKHFVDVVSNDLKRRRRYFLTGFAGCGKTRTLNCLIAKLIAKLGIFRVSAISYTKTAANEVHGSSIHSLFNLGKASLRSLKVEDAVKMLNSNPRKKVTIHNLHTLIIDEVSLLTGKGLDLIDKILRAVRNPKRSFGGVQIVLCGDCLQLPPILEKDESEHQRFFFQADAWFDGKFRVCYLQHIFRQSKMTDLLNDIRDGKVSTQQLEELNQQCGRGISRSLIEFLINVMADLNQSEGTDRNMHSKVQLRFLDSRCGNYNYCGALIPVDSNSPVVRAELNGKPFLDDRPQEGDPPFDIISAMKSAFIVGVENIESDAFSKAIENHTKAIDDGREIVHIEAIDKFYDYEIAPNRNISPREADYVADLLERGITVVADGQIRQYDCRGQNRSKAALHNAWINDCKSPRIQMLSLYVGQSIMFTSNGINRLVANNSQGVIEEIVFDEEKKQVEMLVIKPVGSKGLFMPSVKVFRDRRVIGKQGIPYNRITNLYHYGVREQFPIKPACWANAYSVQGLTFSDMTLIYNNIRARAYMFGYLYVLISRLQDILQFVPLRKLVPEDICAHPAALAFDKYHRSQPIYVDHSYRLFKVTYKRDFDFKANTLNL